MNDDIDVPTIAEPFVQNGSELDGGSAELAAAKAKADENYNKFLLAMADFENYKKRVERQQSEQQAQANRTRFGRTKSERVLDEQRASRADDLLDQHRIDGEDAS